MRERVIHIGLLLLCLNTLFPAEAQNLSYARKSSYYTFVYQITDEQAAALYRDDNIKDFSPFLHQLVTLFPSDSSLKTRLPVGHYLFIRSKGNDLIYNLESINNLEIKVLDNSHDLSLLFYDLSGHEIRSLKPVLGHAPIRFDEVSQSYKRYKTNRQGLLYVHYNGHTNIFKIARRFNNTAIARTGRRLNTTFPINHLYSFVAYVPKTTFYLVKHGYFRPPGIYYRTERLFRGNYQRQEGYVVTNKPKYKPGDTV